MAKGSMGKNVTAGSTSPTSMAGTTPYPNFQPWEMTSRPGAGQYPGGGSGFARMYNQDPYGTVARFGGVPFFGGILRNYSMAHPVSFPQNSAPTPAPQTPTTPAQPSGLLDSIRINPNTGMPI